jgi:serine/threonine protein kinase/tetratricopeptide (TPR) repeat protein
MIKPLEPGSPMSREIELLFREVADLTPEARERHFAESQISAEIRAEVESLLAFDTARLTAPDCIGAAARQYAGSSAGPAEGGRCGPYELVRMLGEGGMGSVFLARRTDGEVEQRVAIKFVHSTRSPAFRERFLRERQILASLSHPGIARLFDAGHTEDGQPYLVMEYVEGVSLDIYCQKLEFREQLKLCLRVCDAISYAHRNLVVHRDLKPSNILVDATGQPKLLDFGIARILDEAADTSMTQERILTPDYASPEQIGGTAHTTATDVYSLGAVMYRLLTGAAPHAPSAGSAEPIEVRICSTEVPAPSKVNPALPRDLDFILGKALRKEPDERYAGVDALAEDLRALLESRPVRARSGSTWYRTRKFLRRHWVPVAAAIVTITGLSIGLLAANRERAIAQRRFNDVRQLSNRLFTIDRQVLGLPGNTKVRQLIVDTSLEYLNRLAADARNDPDLALDVGAAYMRVARVQGVPISANLGQEDDAEKNLRIAEQLIASVLRAQPDNHMAHLRAMQIAHDRMVLAENRRPDTEALPLARQAEAWLEKYLAGGKVDEFDKQQVVIAGMNIAFWYSRKDLTEESLRLLRRTIELAKALNLPAQAGAAQINVARALRSVGDLDGALAAIRDGVRLLEPLSTNAGSAPTFSLALSTQGDVLCSDRGISLGRYREAADSFDRAYRIVLPLARQDAHNELI